MDVNTGGESWPGNASQAVKAQLIQKICAQVEEEMDNRERRRYEILESILSTRLTQLMLNLNYDKNPANLEGGYKMANGSGKEEKEKKRKRK